MNKIWKKYVLVFACFLMITNGFAENSDTTKIPCLKLNNYRVKSLMKNLIKDGSIIKDNDVVLIGVIEENNEQFLSFCFSKKGRLFLLQASSFFRAEKFIGYSKILNHDCFVFGNRTELFFTEKDSLQVPNYFNWLLSLNQMKWEDFFTPFFMKDSDGNVIEGDLHILDRGITYKRVKKRFYPSNVILRPNQKED